MDAIWSHKECTQRAEVGSRTVMSGLGIGSAYWIWTASILSEELGAKGITKNENAF